MESKKVQDTDNYTPNDVSRLIRAEKRKYTKISTLSPTDKKLSQWAMGMIQRNPNS